MPYLPTSQAFLEQSALLLQAYPETTRITTKYSFPTERPAQKKQSKTPAADTAATAADAGASTTPAAPVAALVLKTFNPGTGICLKYRTNKHQEVGRLVMSLGKLAGGADVASLGLSAATGGDVEMVDTPDETAPPAAAAAPAAAAGAGQQGGKSQGQGQGKGKKKGGKGKR